MANSQSSICWRVSGDYLPVNASKAGLLDETRLFLLTYERLQSLDAARQALIDGALAQRSRETRLTIDKIIRRRLVRWSPPEWVLQDLVAFAHQTDEPVLQAALLLHVVRQDRLLYDFVQQVLVPRWEQGEHLLVRADVQAFLDRQEPTHPEISGWSHATRAKLASNVLAILRDYGLLVGKAAKHMVEPLIPEMVATHLVRLLRAEGVTDAALSAHPDWRIWLWNRTQVQHMLNTLADQEAILERSR